MAYILGFHTSSRFFQQIKRNSGIDMDVNHSNLVIDVEAILAEANPPITQDCCIYRVPYYIREVNVNAYTPKFISIGPLHHFDQRLQNMEKHKHVYLKQFVARTKNKLEDLITAVKKEEQKLRHCYKENLEMSSNELVKVILVDASFIIEFFCKKLNQELTDDEEKMFDPTGSLQFDLLLLENQVPFFILEKLYSLVFASQQNPSPPSFLELSVLFFNYFNKLKLEPNFTICHFTDLLRTFHLKQPRPKRKEYNCRHSHIPTASAFNQAMGKFKINESECILDLKFSRGCLKIPHITVEDTTEMLFRNMLALEQYHYPEDCYIADYVYLIDFLINTGKDVEVLVENGILFNYLGNDNDVAKLFNSLGKYIAVDGKSQYTDLIDELKVFYNDPWRQKRVILKRDYCNTPCRTLATCAATAILFLTLIQTFCSILSLVSF